MILCMRLAIAKSARLREKLASRGGLFFFPRRCQFSRAVQREIVETLRPTALAISAWVWLVGSKSTRASAFALVVARRRRRFSLSGIACAAASEQRRSCRVIAVSYLGNATLGITSFRRPSRNLKRLGRVRARQRRAGRSRVTSGRPRTRSWPCTGVLQSRSDTRPDPRPLQWTRGHSASRSPRRD